MRRITSSMFWGVVVLLGMISTEIRVLGHQPVQLAVYATQQTPAAVPGISGQGKMRFKVLQNSDRLPEDAKKVLVSAHGGFAVDHRQGREETYFALPGAGILQISADMKTIKLLETPADMKKLNLHNTKIWYGDNGTAYLTFPSNDGGQVFTTTLDGKLLNTLNTPTANDEFCIPAVNDYFAGKGNFVPTDVEYLDGLYYVTTGYSNLDYVLTARILSLNPFKAMWNDLAFGGRGTGPGQFGTGHGIAVPPGTKRLDIADRPNSEIDRFTKYGQYLSTLKMPRDLCPATSIIWENTQLFPLSTGRTKAKALLSTSLRKTG